MEINFENFSKFEIKVGTILSVENNMKAKKPAYVLEIDFVKMRNKEVIAQITNTQSIIIKKKSYRKLISKKYCRWYLRF